MYAMLKTFYTSRHLAPGGSEGSIGGIPAPLAELELAALPPCLPDDVIEEELRALVRVDPVPELRNGLLLESVIWNGKYVIQMFFSPWQCGIVVIASASTTKDPGFESR
jgi:hypothetical protein